MLEKLVFFENFSEQYTQDALATIVGDEDLIHSGSLRTPSRAAGRGMAEASRDVEHVAASFLVDASHFFSVDASWKWPKLTSLRLTSSLLTPDGDSRDISTLLQAAEAAAAKMPRLEIMELWNGRKGVAGLFRCHAS